MIRIDEMRFREMKLSDFDKFKIYIGKDGAIIACENGMKIPVDLCYREIIREINFDNENGGAMYDAWVGFMAGERWDLNVYPDEPGKFGAVIYPVNDNDQTDTDEYARASHVYTDRDASIIHGGIPKKYRIRATKILTVE